MIKKFINTTKNIEKEILKIIFSSLKFSFIICVVACVILLIYILNPISHILYDSGLILFKTGLNFAIISFVCGFAMDIIKKQII